MERSIDHEDLQLLFGRMIPANLIRRNCGVRSVLWDPVIRFAFDDNNEKLSFISESCNFYSPSCPLLNEDSAELYEALPV